MEFLTTGNYGSNILTKQAEARTAILESWERTGLLNKLSGIKKINIAQLLENQAMYLKESTENNAGSRFDTIAFPVIRRIFDRLLVNNIATIQTLALPSGKVFYMDIRVSFGGNAPRRDKTLQNNISETEQRTRTHLGKTAPKNTAYNSAGPTFAETSAYERYYDLMGWDFSKGRLKNYDNSGYIPVTGIAIQYNFNSLTNIITTNRGNVKVDANLYNPTYPFNVNSKESFTSLRFVFNVLDNNNNILENVSLCYGDSNTPSINDKIVRSNETIRFYSQIQGWGSDIIRTPAPNQILISVILDFQSMIPVNPPYSANSFYLYDFVNNQPVNPSNVTIQIVPTYDVFESLEGESRMGEVTVVFTSQTVETETRKLRAHWTPEVAQDVEAYLSIDIETEYTAILSELIGREIDQEVLNDLIKYAAFRAVWDYNGKATEVGFFGTQKDWNQTLITRINEISAQIYKATLMGGANFVVCSPEVGAIFNDLEYFHVDGSAAPENDKFSLGVEKIGTLGNRIVVYQVAYMPPEIVLVGRKGNSFFETGYIYAPFIPLMLTETITDPNDFTRRKGIMTRYGKVLVNNRFYGLIYVKNVRKYV